MKNDPIRKNVKPIIEKWKQDYTFKTIASSIISFGVTVLFALYHGYLGIRLSSVWHGSICVFYLLLMAIRGVILLTEKRNTIRSEQESANYRYKTFIVSSVILLALNLALILPLSLMVILEKPVDMGLIHAITMAAYTTYKLTMASIHIQKQKSNRHNNILITELRTINFVDALVSILTLQNTLIMVNQTRSSATAMITLSAVSSAAIYIVVLLTTVLLLVKGFKQNKKHDCFSKEVKG